MSTKSIIDMSRPHMLYAGGVGFLMLLSLAMSHVPAMALSQYLEVPFRREASAGLFLAAGLVGGWTLIRHAARNRQPWRVPLSAVSLPYGVFFILALSAIVVSR